MRRCRKAKKSSGSLPPQLQEISDDEIAVWKTVPPSAFTQRGVIDLKQLGLARGTHGCGTLRQKIKMAEDTTGSIFLRRYIRGAGEGAYPVAALERIVERLLAISGTIEK